MAAVARTHGRDGRERISVIPVLQLTGIQKNYHSLRPLRVQELTIAPGERVAIAGLDAGAAEVLVNLVTGASLPDEGDVRVLGRSTADIVDGDAWLASLDRFGIMSPRGVLLESATIEQNMAMPFSLEIDPVPPDVSARVNALAASCGISDVSVLVGDSGPELRARVHLARAIAPSPQLLVLEHPTAGLPTGAQDAFARDLLAAVDRSSMAALVISQDEAFGARVAHRALRLDPATGTLAAPRRRWFR
jgi:predicted ABC-type transport system involved in lysophospholipase L1 biosynthesis ATPase subunit